MQDKRKIENRHRSSFFFFPSFLLSFLPFFLSCWMLTGGRQDVSGQQLFKCRGTGTGCLVFPLTSLQDSHNNFANGKVTRSVSYCISYYQAPCGLVRSCWGILKRKIVSLQLTMVALKSSAVALK